MDAPPLHLGRAAWPDANERRAQVSMLRQVMDRIAVRLSKCEPEEYDLDKNSDFSAVAGARNVIRCTLLMGSYEVR